MTIDAMKSRAFTQVDVFTDRAYLGNPLAVVLDGADLNSDEMQHFARWTQLSETAFLSPPSAAARAQGADYGVRIFTPAGELTFAGHPTLGSCHAWLQAGGRAQSPDYIMQECPTGLIRIRQDGARLAFAAPPLERRDPDPAVVMSIATALGLEGRQILAAQWLDNGPVWLALLLDSAHTVLSLRPDHQQLSRMGHKVGVAHVDTVRASPPLIARSNREARAFGTGSHLRKANLVEPDVQVRAFAAAIGIAEDPVTGSLNASLAQWLIADGRAPSHYVATQGTCLGRHGQVHIDQDEAGQIWVGGDAVTCITGRVNL